MSVNMEELEVFCKQLPKIELHAHLSGSITRECLHEIYKKRKEAEPSIELEDPMIVIPPGKVDYDLETFFPLFSKYIYQLCNDVQSVRYSTKRVLQDFEADGVAYLELRTTPREFKETGMSKEQYVETVLESIEQYEKDASTSMKTVLLLSVDRRDSFQKALECIDLAIRYKYRGVVGVDLCGDPMKGDVTIFREVFSKAQENGLGVTLHFAEAAKTSNDEELLVLLSFKPDRIGHVIHVSDAIRAKISRRKLALELCISCNVHAKMITGSFQDHHFRDWWVEKQCPLILCTDDVGVFCSPLSNEYTIVAQHFGLTRLQLWELSFQTISPIFSGEEEKIRLRNLMLSWREGNKL
ncbi:adenosine/AMP deaminase family protein [Morchella conica CCBAS932]|uniref:Adenosine/AMP deaminase family protein n=2 Tax=Morchella sect. Distantes TaxID=1051054 RepID=A0A3N4KZ97_9PEZI|nr:adenosine/AMP deaminase family protein [Morchella conica CCBAS932]